MPNYPEQRPGEHQPGHGRMDGQEPGGADEQLPRRVQAGQAETEQQRREHHDADAVADPPGRELAAEVRHVMRFAQHQRAGADHGGRQRRRHGHQQAADDIAHALGRHVELQALDDPSAQGNLGGVAQGDREGRERPSAQPQFAGEDADPDPGQEARAEHEDDGEADAGLGPRDVEVAIREQAAQDRGRPAHHGDQQIAGDQAGPAHRVATCDRRDDHGRGLIPRPRAAAGRTNRVARP